MFSRKYRCTLVLFLMVSTGAASLQAAPGRSGTQNAGPIVQVDLSTRSLMEIMKNLWQLLKDAPPGTDPHPQTREGPGMDPIGQPHPGNG